MSLTANMKRYTIDLVVLSLLLEKEMYGYQICKEVSSRTNGVYILEEGSMYPILYRLEGKGLVSSRSELVGKRRKRMYYTITEAGKIHVETLRQEYLLFHNCISDIINKEEIEKSGHEVL